MGVDSESWGIGDSTKYYQLRWKTAEERIADADLHESSISIFGLSQPDLTAICEPTSKKLLQIDVIYTLDRADPESIGKHPYCCRCFSDSVRASVSLVSSSSIAAVNEWLDGFTSERLPGTDRVEIFHFGDIDIMAGKVTAGMGDPQMIQHREYEIWDVKIVPTNDQFMLFKSFWVGWGDINTSGHLGYRRLLDKSNWSRIDMDSYEGR